MTRTAPSFALALLLGGGCATAVPPPQGPGEGPAPLAAATPPPPAPPPPPTCTALARPGVLRRSAVARVVDAGLGQWLAGGVEVDRSPPPGRRFEGWVVRSLYPGDPCYRDVDVQIGDVVVRINGKSIERPEQAQEVFSSLRSAPALVLDLIRAGQSRTVTLPIVEP
jgi:hypothetical protein